MENYYSISPSSVRNPFCVTCMYDPQHEEHLDQIVDFRTGLKEVKASMDKQYKEFEDNAKKVEVCAEILKQDINSLEKYMEMLSVKCQDVETILNQMKQQLELVAELRQPLIDSHHEIKTHFADVQNQMTEVNILQQDSDVNFIRKIKVCRRNCDSVMNGTKNLLSRRIRLPESIKQTIKIVGNVGEVKIKEVNLKEKLMASNQPGVLEQYKSGTEQVLRSSPRQKDKNQDNETNNLELKLEIKPTGTVEVKKPLEVVSVGDGTVILVDESLSHLQRINTEGKVVGKYQIGLPFNKVKNACVYGNYLFVLTSENVITKMSFDGFGRSTHCKPERVETINYISAIGDNVILITEGWLPGRISEYNTETNKVIKIVSGIWNPGKVSVVQDGRDTKYIVKDYQFDLEEWEVNIYNRTWTQISSIDTHTDALTVTPGGNLLLVCQNRILEYSQEGRFIRDLLDKYKFNNIRDITYSGECLWVLESEPHCIKIFN